MGAGLSKCGEQVCPNKQGAGVAIPLLFPRESARGGGEARESSAEGRGRVVSPGFFPHSGEGSMSECCVGL